MHPQELATTTHLISFLHPFNFSREKGVIPFGWPRITPSWRKFGSRGEHRCCGIACRASQETLRVGPEARCGGGQHAQDIHFPQQQWLNYSILSSKLHRSERLLLLAHVLGTQVQVKKVSNGDALASLLSHSLPFWLWRLSRPICVHKGRFTWVPSPPLMLAKSQLVPTFEPQENHG